MVRIRERGGVFEVYVGNELYESFYLREEAELYAEVLKSDLSWEKVRSLVRESVEGNLGACEIFSLRVEFPHVCYEVCVKGKQLSGEIEIERGTFGSEERVAEAVLRKLSSFFEVPLPVPSSIPSGRKRGEAAESLWG